MRGLPAVATLAWASTMPAHAAQWVGPYAVATVEVSAAGLYFGRPGGFPNPDGCPAPPFIHVEGDANLINRTLSVALTGKAMGKQIRLYISGCSSQGYIRGHAIEIQE